MTRTPSAKHRGRYRHGLFDNPGQATAEPEIGDNPRERACPWPPCRAQVGEPCTIRRNGRREPMTSGYHPARTEPGQT